MNKPVLTLSLIMLFYSSIAMSNGCNIFVTRLNFQTQDFELREVFEQFGTVNKASVVMDRATGKSRGFGFVEMPNCNEAQIAIEALDQTDFQERTIVVKLADGTNSNRSNNRSDYGNGRGGGRGGYGGGRKY